MVISPHNEFKYLTLSHSGSFWLSLGITLDPNYQVQQTLGMTGPAFNSAFGLYLIFWALYVYFLSIAALKTNVTLFIIVFFVAMTFNLLGVTYFKLASGDLALASTLATATGAVGFVSSVAGYWILLHLILASVEFPVNVPLGDLSRFYKKREAA